MTHFWPCPQVIFFPLPGQPPPQQSLPARTYCLKKGKKKKGKKPQRAACRAERPKAPLQVIQVTHDTYLKPKSQHQHHPAPARGIAPGCALT